MHKYKALSGILGALPAFESASRFMSFTKAGLELGLTQPAVSRRIADLERVLGVPVFQRDHNKLQLTREGYQLLEAIELNLGNLNEVARKIAEGQDKRKLTIACGFSFVSLWFLPRFNHFRKVLNDLEVHLITSEYPDELNPEMVDIRIIWQNKTWPNRDVRTLFQEKVFPVCSPSFAKVNGLSTHKTTPLKKLCQLPFLHCVTDEPNFLNWTSWFSLHDINYTLPDQSYIYDNYHLTIQAALEGEGVALGQSCLIDALLNNGSLIRLGPDILHEGNAHLIEFETSRVPKELRDEIHAWFLQETEHHK